MSALLFTMMSLAATEPTTPTMGLFSVGEGKQVTFSKGNLQYTRSTDTWSFAENQWDIIGTDNVTTGVLADKIDLFGWSTSINDFGVSTSTNDADYAGDFVDWGTSQIGADDPNTWRTLTYGEWFYLIQGRDNYSSLYGIAQVNGVNGFILLPDNWTRPDGVTFKSGFSSESSAEAYGKYQTYTAEEWSKLESAGAVFLPASGARSGSNVSGTQNYGQYWSSSNYLGYVYISTFSPAPSVYYDFRYYGRSVRLVKDVVEGTTTPEEPTVDSTRIITYTSTDSNVVTPYNAEVFGANIVSNIYENGVGTITFDAPVTSIGTYAFRDCSSLTSIIIPNSVTSIGEGAFQYCSSLTSVTIPNSVTSIGGWAFYDCSSLNSIRVEATIPPNLGADVFSVSVSICYIPCGATYSYELTDWRYYVDAFVELGCDICGDDLVWEYNNTQLSITGHGEMYDYDLEPQPWQQYRNKMQTISLPEGMTSIGAAAFAECKYVKSVTIPSTVEKIHDSAFEDCRMLSSLSFAEPSALTSIGNWAFYNCHKLQYITIPEGVTEIGEAAFFDCTYLSELTLPASMEYIADNGFALCAKLRRMNVNATTPPQVEARTFEDVDRTIPVVVPDESVSVYKSAPVWQEFNIVGKNNVPSAVDNVDASNRSTKKLLRDGNLVIIRDGVEYNVMGQQL